MDTSKDADADAVKQRQPQPRRRSYNKKNSEGQEDDESNSPVEQLVANGWSREKAIMADKIFLCSCVVVEGRVHATNKLCLCGKLVATEGLECGGNFTLCGKLGCWGKPIVVKNMIVMTQGVIYGDMMATAGVYIHGECSVKGTLTVTGPLKIKGSLRCSVLNLTGPITVYKGPGIFTSSGGRINGTDITPTNVIRAVPKNEDDNRVGEAD
ncbi:hypothetical protein SAMD00023353_1900950 [Rosellinia necatrix]|uniref:Polymer-forming cytoskeletal protein n=1 Tax=Rosellinia necatrix TaxID=77044 RepID=A0A1W2TEN9_ROSNE|nr:hypothetical protein SAMD00023353_1900950 [Rosellinia necatrix]